MVQTNSVASAYPSEQGNFDEFNEEKEINESDQEIVDVLQKEIEVLRGKIGVATGKELRKSRTLLGLREGQLQRKLEGNYGRTIPASLVLAVEERDTGRNFGRPNHECAKPGPPHHIKHFADFTGSHTRANPHTLANLEAPCKNCHNLAHALDIPSGVSIEIFFRSISAVKWKVIEELWKQQKISELKIYSQ
jgi:hypothetical protein